MDGVTILCRVILSCVVGGKEFHDEHLTYIIIEFIVFSWTFFDPEKH